MSQPAQSDATPARTPLYDLAVAAGGRMIDFNGWDMAVQFSGITAEHQAVRTGVGVFDLGHMGRLRVEGVSAAAFLERHACRRVADMALGKVRYALVLATDGTVEDDILISRESADAFHVVVNAGNRAKIVESWRETLLREVLPSGVTLTDASEREAMIAVQGPQAWALLTRLGLPPLDLKPYAFRDLQWNGAAVRLSRTGYTGEDGAELFIPSERVAELWQAVIAAGATPCGLGARDTLRTEAAMPLYGHELDRSVTPIEAGLAFAVNPAGGFIGAERVLAQLAGGAERTLIGLCMRDRRVPRQGYAVLQGDVTVGAITSGTLSPTLGLAIGMAYVPKALAAIGTELLVDVRGTRCAAEVVSLPFYKRAR